MLKRPNSFTMDIENLDIYYEDCVIGGPGAFVVPIREREQFKEATRTKLVLEIAGRTPERRVTQVQARAPRVSCTVGERMWRGRAGRAPDEFAEFVKLRRQRSCSAAGPRMGSKLVLRRLRRRLMREVALRGFA